MKSILLQLLDYKNIFFPCYKVHNWATSFSTFSSSLVTVRGIVCRSDFFLELRKRIEVYQLNVKDWSLFIDFNYIFFGGGTVCHCELFQGKFFQFLHNMYFTFFSFFHIIMEIRLYHSLCNKEPKIGCWKFGHLPKLVIYPIFSLIWC